MLTCAQAEAATRALVRITVETIARERATGAISPIPPPEGDKSVARLRSSVLHTVAGRSMSTGGPLASEGRFRGAQGAGAAVDSHRVWRGQRSNSPIVCQGRHSVCRGRRWTVIMRRGGGEALPHAARQP